MKILHVIPSLRKGGAERIALDICTELISRGHEVKLVTLNSENQYKFITGKINYECVKTQLELSVIRKNQVNVTALQNIIDKFEPEVIHSHLFEAEINLAFCQFPRGMKRIIHFHDNMVQMKSFNINSLSKKSSITNYYERYLVLKNLPKYTTAIAISKNSLHYLETNLPKNIKKVLLPNAIDLKRFKRNNNKNTNHNLIMIGSLNELKGQELAIRTVAELKTRKIVVDLTLIGDGPLAEKLKELTFNLKIEMLVQFKGYYDYPEKLLEESSIYIHTSHSEAFGLVLIEAMACGLPVVCTDGKGNRDLIQDGENGFMIWERDPKLLADKIQFLLENEQEYARICNNAYKFAQNFGMESYTDLLINTCYNE